ncbi:GNAT family N-acetyltransferase [Asticcacaulis solisilvae]|uniref:GNAT family N-acetyltransferase n=1 Tax=Asticcacaulis solisilvae TaxID=1217274 RepID=UPI003FD7EB75
MDIKEGQLDDPRVLELLETHVARARAETAPGKAHALDVSGLKTSDIRFFTLWDGDDLLGCGALKTLSPDHGPSHGEVKSMHTAEARRKSGAGGRILTHMISEARAMGLGRLSLETGTWPYFHAAYRFYLRHGFIDCPPFAGYEADPDRRFMTLDLNAPRPDRNRS